MCELPPCSYFEDETMNENEKKPPDKPEWQKRDFKINKQMKEVIQASVGATEAELAVLKRKLEKLQYGS